MLDLKEEHREAASGVIDKIVNRDNGSLADSWQAYISFINEEKVILDGEFSLAELRAVVDLMGSWSDDFREQVRRVI